VGVEHGGAFLQEAEVQDERLKTGEMDGDVGICEVFCLYTRGMWFPGWRGIAMAYGFNHSDRRRQCVCSL
jgi:hypothetical protein